MIPPKLLKELAFGDGVLDAANMSPFLLFLLALQVSVAWGLKVVIELRDSDTFLDESFLNRHETSASELTIISNDHITREIAPTAFSVCQRNKMGNVAVPLPPFTFWLQSPITANVWLLTCFRRPNIS
nr:unnamed protein product [Spirometra erinaceieuropaei]